MKKLLLILTIGIISSPIFASDFNEAVFNVDMELKKEISGQLVKNVETTIQHNKQTNSRKPWVEI